jgi:hypothetical protein
MLLIILLLGLDLLLPTLGAAFRRQRMQHALHRLSSKRPLSPKVISMGIRTKGGPVIKSNPAVGLVSLHNYASDTDVHMLAAMHAEDNLPV